VCCGVSRRLTCTSFAFSALTKLCANASEFVGALAATQAAYGVDHSYGRYAIEGPRETHRRLHETWWAHFWNTSWFESGSAPPIDFSVVQPWWISHLHNSFNAQPPLQKNSLLGQSDR
jgi:hypothetical protein